MTDETFWLPVDDWNGYHGGDTPEEAAALWFEDHYDYDEAELEEYRRNRVEDKHVRQIAEYVTTLALEKAADDDDIGLGDEHGYPIPTPEQLEAAREFVSGLLTDWVPYYGTPTGRTCTIKKEFDNE